MRTKRGMVQILWAIPVLIVVCLIGLSALANDTGPGGTKPATQTSRYIFLSDQSKLVQTGGIAGLHWTYSVEGEFVLTVDPNAGVASFSQVDANTTDDSPYRRSLDPNEVFNMTSLLGTVLEDTTVLFTGKATDGSDVRITATLQDDRVHLVAQTVPPPNSADFFVFNMDALAQRKYSGGTEESNDPYQITTAADLIALGETPEDYDKHFILTDDIDLDPNLPGRRVFDRAIIAQDTDLARWDFQGTPFAGVFDGNNRSLSNLTIQGNDKNYVGLFGQLSGQVKNLGIVDVNITGSGAYVGGLIGYSVSGLVTDCCCTGVIGGRSSVGGLVGYNDRAEVTRCSSTGVVRGTESYVGGLMGYNLNGTGTLCRSIGTVRGEENVGGLAGWNNGHVSRCYSTGAVFGFWDVGGLVGENRYGTVTHCYSRGTVSGTSHVGGLAGVNGGSLDRCYSTGAVDGGTEVGGLVGYDQALSAKGIAKDCFWDIQTSGQATSAGGTGKTTAEMQRRSTFLDVGWDFVSETANGTKDIWWILEGRDYPRLWWERYSGGSGTANDPYRIATAADLMLLGESPEDYGKHFVLTADIDLDPNLPGRKVFDKAVIGSFTGVFDGNGHRISHLRITGGIYLGLFSDLRSGAEVRDLGIADVNITGSDDYVSGLVGINGGELTGCYSTGVVSGRTSVGGLVGDNWGTVAQCYSTCAVSGGNGVGGLMGENSKGTVSNCYSNGPVRGTGRNGGLTAYNLDVVIHCFWDIQTSGQAASAGGTGKTTAEMQMAATYLNAGWDFVGETANGTQDIWWINEGKDYPRLWWQLDVKP